MADIADVVGGGTPSTSEPANFDGGDIPWITPADLSGYREKHISRGVRNITERGLKHSGARLMPAGTVLFSSRAPVGYVAIAANPVTTNQGFKNFVLASGVDPSYVYFYLKHARALIETLAGGTTFKEISGARATQIPVPLAPLPEQYRIVAEIERRFARLDAAVASLQRARANLRRYRASVLKAACEGRLVPTEAELARREGRDYEPASVLLERIMKERRARREEPGRHRGRHREPEPPALPILPLIPEGWVWTTLGQLCDVSTGSTPLTTTREYYDGGTIPWVTSAAVNSLQVTAAEKWVTERAVREHRLRRYPAGTLILAMYGEGHNRGKVAELLLDATINQALAALLFEGLSDLCRSYVRLLLLSRYEETRRAAVGGVQPNLNLSAVGRIPVPLPPLAEQQRIVAEVERRLSVIETMESVVETNLKRSERLRQAILRRAFEGKLVPQDPTDEPASVLLERIRAERERDGSQVPIRSQRGQPAQVLSPLAVKPRVRGG